MDPRLDAVPLVASFAARLPDAVPVVGVYVGGSLASGDYQPGRSDLDAVAVVEHRPDGDVRRRLTRLHRDLVRTHPGADALHCCYLPLDDLTDVGTAHWTWAFGELFERPLSGVARAELLLDPVVVSGPAPSTLLEPMDDESVRAAVRGELTGYWTRALTRRRIWLQDTYVDLGLVTVSRVHITLAEGRLVTKREAIERLPEVGVPPELADEVARRRRGEPVRLTWGGRRRRARLVRGLVADAITRLT